MSADLSDTIASVAAAAVKTVQTDAGSTTVQPIADLIAADRYLAAKAAASSPGRGVLFSKFIKGTQIGSVGGQGLT